ncbi:hypothetical protein SAMN04488024_102407 [Pedobacter soli]|uniref:Uncharacterized protein n=3 Tax=Pedobacter TaxID=84567 RepID=A0A1G6MPW3_9SPHI|nr:hypothetical protein SAMN04488024_102407 [Pedobacter soli]
MQTRTFFMPVFLEQKGYFVGSIDMKKQVKTENEPSVIGQDFANPDKEVNKKQPSHGEVANQKGGDFSELEKSRMENPPQHRVNNGSDKDDVDNSSRSNQSKGVK